MLLWVSRWLLCVSEEAEPQKDPLLQLVSLQKAAGCWELNASFGCCVLGRRRTRWTNQKAAQVGHILWQADDWLSACVWGVFLFMWTGSVWATVLALIWLYVFKSDQQDEWQFVAMKAASWIRAHKRETIFKLFHSTCSELVLLHVCVCVCVCVFQRPACLSVCVMGTLCWDRRWLKTCWESEDNLSHKHLCCFWYKIETL